LLLWIPPLEIRPLRYFAVLADELHFGSASAKLRIAQPALSQAIRRLESRPGFALFTRTSRKVELTRQGASFLASTQRIFGELRRGVEAGREIAAGRIGSVTIGHTVLAMVTVLPVVLRRFRERHPLVRLTMRELPSATQIEDLRAGYLDVAMVSGTCDDDSISSVALRRDAPFCHRRIA
jgi:DNA-binding transcriptional LysR family regulator